jgi:cytochrome oxidase Cu insertion factor (SCO1/SenC/PrrC family)
MKAFLTQHYPRFTGLTGSLEAIESAKKQFRVFAKKNPAPDDAEKYVVPREVARVGSGVIGLDTALLIRLFVI